MIVNITNWTSKMIYKECSTWNMPYDGLSSLMISMTLPFLMYGIRCSPFLSLFCILSRLENKMRNLLIFSTSILIKSRSFLLFELKDLLFSLTSTLFQEVLQSNLDLFAFLHWVAGKIVPFPWSKLISFPPGFQAFKLDYQLFPSVLPFSCPNLPNSVSHSQPNSE